MAFCHCKRRNAHGTETGQTRGTEGQQQLRGDGQHSYFAYLRGEMASI